MNGAVPRRPWLYAIYAGNPCAHVPKKAAGRLAWSRFLSCFLDASIM
jgi:hypothetical protein